MTHARALAIGLLMTMRDAAELRELRLTLVLHAADEGYAVAEVFHLDGDSERDEATYLVAEELAQRLDAQAVVSMGAVDRPRVEELAARVRLMVLEVIPEASDVEHPS